MDTNTQNQPENNKSIGFGNFNSQQLMIIISLIIPLIIIFYKIIPQYTDQEFSFIAGLFLGSYFAFMIVPLILSLLINSIVYFIKKYNTKVLLKYSDSFPIVFLIITIIYSILTYHALNLNVQS